MIDSDTKSSPTSALKPELAIALGSLEVQLEQELTRYRRNRNSIRQPKKANPDTPIADQDQNSNSTSEKSTTSESATTEFNQNILISSTPKPDLETPQLEEIDHIQGGSAQDTVTTFTPLEKANLSSSIVPTKQTTEDETIISTNTPTTHPDDYLESSEALLRSLQDQEPETKKPNNYNDTLLSPLGIGSMLLLLLASLTLGYVVLNPQTFPQFNFSQLKFWNFNFSSNNQEPEVNENNTTSTSTDRLDITPVPNLANSEFPEVKNPKDVVGLKPKPKPTPTTIPQPTNVNRPQQPIRPTALPAVTPNPQETLPGLDDDIQPSADGYYYLITDNQGNDALAQAQQVVPDAYLSDGKKYIYLGALTDKEEVKQRLEQLKAEGITARVRQP